MIVGVVCDFVCGCVCWWCVTGRVCTYFFCRLVSLQLLVGSLVVWLGWFSCFLCVGVLFCSVGGCLCVCVVTC